VTCSMKKPSNNAKLDSPIPTDYKNYVNEMYGLDESPSPIGSIHLNADANDNSYYAKEVDRRSTYVGIFPFNGENLLGYEAVDSNNTRISLLNASRTTLVMEHSYERISSPIKGIVNLHIWHHKTYPGIMRKWFDVKVIPEEPTIISDKALTPLGFKFWQWLYGEYTANKHSHNMLVLDMKSGSIVKDVTELKEMDDYYRRESYDYRFVLTRKGTP
jgi:hypothetical protein